MDNLLGTWSLISLLDIVDGEERPRPYQVKGRLFYHDDQVFVGLGYYKSSGYFTNFYSGTFKTLNNKVFHSVELSSHESRNGKVLERGFEIVDNNTLILTGLNPEGKKVKLIWSRDLVS